MNYNNLRIKGFINDYFTVEQAAKELKCSKSKIYSLIKKNNIKSVKKNNRRFVFVKSLKEYQDKKIIIQENEEKDAKIKILVSKLENLSPQNKILYEKNLTLLREKELLLKIVTNFYNNPIVNKNFKSYVEIELKNNKIFSKLSKNKTSGSTKTELNTIRSHYEEYKKICEIVDPFLFEKIDQIINPVFKNLFDHVYYKNKLDMDYFKIHELLNSRYDKALNVKRSLIKDNLDSRIEWETNNYTRIENSFKNQKYALPVIKVTQIGKIVFDISCIYFDFFMDKSIISKDLILDISSVFDDFYIMDTEYMIKFYPSFDLEKTIEEVWQYPGDIINIKIFINELVVSEKFKEAAKILDLL